MSRVVSFVIILLSVLVAPRPSSGSWRLSCCRCFWRAAHGHFSSVAPIVCVNERRRAWRPRPDDGRGVVIVLAPLVFVLVRATAEGTRGFNIDRGAFARRACSRREAFDDLREFGGQIRH